ncbi:MAG: Spy/CpxP family protein refolding chaperone, partial [Blastocatellia bacterium]
MLAALIFAVMTDAQAQLRRPGRLQKKIEKMQERRGGKKFNPPGNSTGAPISGANTATTPPTNGSPESAPPKTLQAGKHSLDGARQKGIRGIIRDEERDLIIRGFGNPAALTLIFRQLDLTDQQKQEIRAIRQRVGDRIPMLQNAHRLLDLDLTEAIYGENFDPKRVEELASQVAEKQGELIKLRASIESQLRQVMTPDQFYVFHFLIGEM